MRRTNWKTVSTLVSSMALLVGCQDQSVVAPGSASAAPAPAMLAPLAGPQLSLNRGSPDNTTEEFTLGPSGGVFFTGNNAVVFPANSVCDPAKSSYGPGTWDSPCVELKSTIRVRAVVRTEKGRSWVDFSPALRFVPSTNPSRWVWMYMNAPAAVGARDLARFNILYAASIGGSVVDESSSDATLRTYVNTTEGTVHRRIKHFSGYTSSGGFACDPLVDEDCFPNPTVGASLPPAGP